MTENQLMCSSPDIRLVGNKPGFCGVIGGRRAADAACGQFAGSREIRFSESMPLRLWTYGKDVELAITASRLTPGTNRPLALLMGVQLLASDFDFGTRHTRLETRPGGRRGRRHQDLSESWNPRLRAIRRRDISGRR